MNRRDFLIQLEKRLESLSREQLLTIIKSEAESVKGSERELFLKRFNQPALKKTTKKRSAAEHLIGTIEEFKSKAESGHYSDGWGWDDDLHDERLLGDESWVKEVEGFLEDARELFSGGDYRNARIAYEMLFALLDDEEIELPCDFSPEEMLESDVNEHKARYLRCIYLDEPPESRAETIYSIVSEMPNRYIENAAIMQSIIGVDTSVLPDLTAFLGQWIAFLRKNADSKRDKKLLREAVILKDGIKGLAGLALSRDINDPDAFIDWANLLMEKRQYKKTIEAGEKGFKAINADLCVRSTLARIVIEAAEKTGDTGCQLAAAHEAFYSDPTTETLATLHKKAAATGQTDIEMKKAVERINGLLSAEKKKPSPALAVDYAEYTDASATKQLLVQAFLLRGDIDSAIDTCKGTAAVGWSYGDNPLSFVVPWLLQLIAFRKNGHQYPNVTAIWRRAFRTFRFGWGDNETEIDENPETRQVFENAMTAMNVTSAGCEGYLNFCQSKISARTDKIVGGTHRRSYYKAAELLAAQSEVYAACGMKQKGENLIERYRKKFNRHSAFKAELSRALNRTETGK